MFLTETSQQLSCPCEPSTHVAFSDAEDIGDLAVRHTLENHRDNLAIAERQLLNGGVKAFLLLLGGERLLWTGLRVHHLQVARQLGCRQAVSSNVRKAPIVRNPKDERAL